MVPLAPRYDPRILVALRTLDDRTESMAEVCRRVGVVAEEMGLIRPSYVHLRRFLVDERDRQDEEEERREEIRRIASDVATRLLLGKFVDPYDVAERIDDAGRKRSL